MEVDTYYIYNCPVCGEKLFEVTEAVVVRKKCTNCSHIIELMSRRKPKLIDLGNAPVADESLSQERCPTCGRRLCDGKEITWLRTKCTKCRHVIILGGGMARDLGRQTA